MSSFAWKALGALVLYLGTFLWGFNTGERFTSAQWEAKWKTAIAQATGERLDALQKQIEAANRVTSDANTRSTDYEEQVLALEKELENYTNDWLSADIEQTPAPETKEPPASAGASPPKTVVITKPCGPRGSNALSRSDVERLSKLGRSLPVRKHSTPTPPRRPEGIW
jgi:hypothetical protein